MTNDIPQQQNARENLDCLAAQWHVYSWAKRLVAIQVIISFPVMIVVDALVRAIGIQYMWIPAAVASLITAINALWLEPRSYSLAGVAARIQEQFDVAVLNIDENLALAGRLIPREEIALYAGRFLKRKGSCESLRDWYPAAVGDLPLIPARIICQRSNLWWDSSLRKSFSRDIFILIALAFLVLASVSLILDLSLRLFILFAVLPILPMLVFSARYLVGNRNLCAKLEEIRGLAEQFWERALRESISGDEASKEARQIQDVILTKRESSPLIFDWYYRMRRKEQQKQMEYSVEHMVKLFQQKGDT